MTKKKAESVDVADQLSDLLEFANSLLIPAGSLDDEVKDVCNSEAREKAIRINNGSLLDQLECLVESGYATSRIKELIIEASKLD